MIKKFTVIFCLFILLGGCSSVLSKKPMGDSPVVLEPAQWDGVWVTPQGAPVMMKVKDGNKGLLKLAWIEDDKEMTFKSHDVAIRGSGRWQFANIKDEENKGAVPENYLWARISKEKNLLLVWLPNVEKFAGLVEKVILPGEVTKGTVIIGELKPEHMRIITSEDKGFLFDWEKPFILMKRGE